MFNISLPQVPEFDEVGVEVVESSQGDYFEIYGMYLGSNENMDNSRIFSLRDPEKKGNEHHNE